MRRAHTALFAALIAVSGCDPIYIIGARVRLGPPAPDSCVLASMRRSLGQAPFEGVDLRSASSGGIRIPMRILSTDADSVWTFRGNSELVIEPQKDSTLALEVRTTFWGTAKNVPIAQQRSYIAGATSMLDSVRAVCAPQSTVKVECIAKGLGGHKACEAGA